MGLKSGSRDAGLDDEEEEAVEDSEQPDPDQEPELAAEPDTTTAESDDQPAPGDDDSVETDDRSGGRKDSRPTMSSIPYKLRRKRVNEGREQVPYFLREEIIAEEAELQDTLEDILGEDVYKSDYREAAMVVAQRNPGLVAEVLREWGYDLDL